MVGRDRMGVRPDARGRCVDGMLDGRKQNPTTTQPTDLRSPGCPQRRIPSPISEDRSTSCRPESKRVGLCRRSPTPRRSSSPLTTRAPPQRPYEAAVRLASGSRCPARVRLRSPRPVVRAWRAVLPASPRRRDGLRPSGTHRCARGRGGSRRARDRRAARREPGATRRRVRPVARRAAGRARLASTTPAPQRGESRHPYRGSTCPRGRRHGAGRVAGRREMGVRSGPDRCSYP